MRFLSFLGGFCGDLETLCGEGNTGEDTEDLDGSVAGAASDTSSPVAARRATFASSFERNSRMFGRRNSFAA